MTNLSGHLAVFAYLGQPEPHYCQVRLVSGSASSLHGAMLIEMSNVTLRNTQDQSHVTAEESSDLVSEAGPQSAIRGLEPSIIGLLLVLISSGAQPRPQHACTRHRYPEENSCGHVYQHQQNFLYMIRFGNWVVN